LLFVYLVVQVTMCCFFSSTSNHVMVI